MTVLAIPDQKIAELADQIDLADVEKSMNYTLADAIREGSTVTDQAVGSWQGPSGEMCALSAATLACKARRILT